MNIITVTEQNLAQEHICCAIASNEDCQVKSKKSWMADRFADGLVFKKGDVRGKCFIEYIPAEKAWAPVEAENYMYIDCLWVSGQFKGHGYSNDLLEACIRDSKEKGKCGLVTLSSPKKMPYLADPKYLRYKGFQPADTAAPYFELMYLPFDSDAVKPRFKPQVKNPAVGQPGFVVYYTAQCPYTAKYTPLIAKMAQDRGIPFTAIQMETVEQAQAAPAAWPVYSVFCDGQFVTHEILSEKRFEKLAAAYEAAPPAEKKDKK